MKRRSQVEPEEEEEEESESDEQLERSALRRERRHKRQERIVWWSNKLHAALWIGLSALAFALSDFGNTVVRSKDILRTWFYLGLALFVAVSLSVIYMSFRQYRREQSSQRPPANNNNNNVRLHDENNPDAAVERARLTLEHPILLPFTTFGTVAAFLFMSVGLWPVYRIFAPILLVTFWFGLVMTLHFIPYS